MCEKLSKFVSLCHILIFCNIVNKRYVGTSDYDLSKIITDVERELTHLRLEYRFKGQVQTLTPDDLYRRYQDFVPLLLEDANEWYLHIAVLFLNALPVTLKELVVGQRYKLPRFSLLSTKILQKHKLEVLREKMVTSQQSFEEETK